MSNYSIDLNCDMGESFGAFQMGQDKAILPFISSANIACGFHAGDPRVMKQTVQLAIHHGVAIGAHPGLPDLQGFGRRNISITPEEAYDMVVYQIGALYGFIQAAGGTMQHVKPHGALYNMAATNHELAAAIAEAVYAISPRLMLYGLAGSALISAAERTGLHAVAEVFSDRSYQPDGTLTPRHLPDALISDPQLAVAQVMRMVADGTGDTVCIHGDGPHATSFASAIYHALQKEKITVQSPLQRN